MDLLKSTIESYFKEAIQQLMKPVVEAKVKDLTARFREDRIDQEVTNGLSGIVELNSKISCLDKELVRQLMHAMLECCGRQYGTFPRQPSMEFVYKNCDAIAKTIRLGETVLGEQESREIFERNPGLKTWLQSHEMLRRGTLEKFSAPAPPVDILLEGKREEARSKCPEGTKKLVSDWFPHFLCPKEAVDDLQRSQACFTTAKGEKIEIAALGRESKDINEVACQFAKLSTIVSPMTNKLLS